MFELLFYFLSLINFSNFHQAKKETPLERQEIVVALIDSHQEVFDAVAKENRIAMAWAQIALENGHGKKVYNYNLGNIGASTKEPYYILGGSRFKSLPSANDGAVFYWKTLKKMCPGVLNVFDQGNAKHAANKLYNCGYFRSDPDDYGDKLKSLYYFAHNKLLKN